MYYKLINSKQLVKDVTLFFGNISLCLNRHILRFSRVQNNLFQSGSNEVFYVFDKYRTSFIGIMSVAKRDNQLLDEIRASES